MKNNNLINTISHTQQYAIRRWFIISTLLLSATIIVIIVLEIPQLYALQSIKKENIALYAQTAPFDQVMAEQHKLQQEEQQCREKQKVINQYRQELTHLIDNLSHIIHASTSDIMIESLQIKNHHFELTARCTQPQQATNFITQLSQAEQFGNLRLTSLQKTEQKPSFLFTVQGTW